MRFEHTMTYDASPEAVHAMLMDKAFRERVCTAVRSPDYSIDITDDAGVTVVIIEQTQRVRHVPAFAARLVGETIRIRHEERWASADRADLDVSIPGKPGHLKGTLSLRPSASGTTEAVSGDLKVSIPLMGGKLEPMIAGLLREAMTTEERVGRKWLAG